jgi:hypothetical protein
MVFKDCHSWNVLFDYCQPRLIDFGSIGVGFGDATWLDGLCKSFIRPLWICKLGRTGRLVARQMMREHVMGLGLTLARTRAAFYVPPGLYWLRWWYRIDVKSGTPSYLHSFFARLEQYVESLEPKAPPQYWSDYPQDERAPSRHVAEKQQTVREILTWLEPDSVLDMGANKGWYAFMAEGLGCRVVAFDSDEYCVDQMYLRGQAETKRVLPLHMDFLCPTPQSGPALAWRTAFDRLQSEVSLVLALVHHLALRQDISFEHIAHIVDRYTRRASVVEFVPPEDEQIGSWPVPVEYTKTNLIAAMSKCGFRLDAERSLMTGRSILVFARPT